MYSTFAQTTLYANVLTAFKCMLFFIRTWTLFIMYRRRTMQFSRRVIYLPIGLRNPSLSQTAYKTSKTKLLIDYVGPTSVSFNEF